MPRILVIDDQSDVRAMISIVLRVHGFELVGAASGTAGLKEFEDSTFDLAMVDIFLQGTNGLDVIRAMRELIPNFPIIAMSGMTALDFVSASPGLTNVVCLQKPFRPNQLIRAIEAAYGQSRPSVAGNAIKNAPANRGVERRDSVLQGLMTPLD
jgi:DNA-binding response OmpR family regulator